MFFGGDKIKILNIGNEILNKHVDNASVRSSISFLEYDILLLDLDLFDNYGLDYYPKFQGKLSLNEDSSFQIREDASRIKHQIKEMLENNKTIFIFTPLEEKVFVKTGEKNYSGTGRNRKSSDIVTEFSNFSFLPFNIETTSGHGSDIAFNGKSEFKPLWDLPHKKFYYKSYFSEKNPNSFMKISKTEKSIAYHEVIGDGNILFIPYFELNNKNKNKFVDSLIKVTNLLKRDLGDFNAPDWTDDIKFPNEKTLKKDIIDLQKQIKEINKSIAEKNSIIKEFEENKILLFGKHKILEIQVSKILEKIGFNVTPGITNEEDIILEYKDLKFIVEVKGIKKSCALKHIRQLDNWVLNFEKNFPEEFKPKGLLIINTFNETPYNERTNEKDFPKNVLELSKIHEFCLLKTDTLLNIYYDIMNNPSKKDKIISSLHENVNVYEFKENYIDQV